MNTLDTTAFVGKFVDEARDRLKALTAAVLRLEEVPGAQEAMADVLRQGHNLKGSARMLGLLDIAQIVHHLEEVFVAAQPDARRLDARAFDVVFSTIDALSVRVEQLARGLGDPPPDVSALCRMLAGLAAAPVPALDLATTPEPADSAASGAAAPVASVRQSLRVPVEKLDGLTHLAAELVIQSLKASQRHVELRRLDTALGRLRDRAREARLAPAAAGSTGPEFGEYAEALEQLSRRLRQFCGEFSDDRVRLNLITEEFRQTVISLTMLPLLTVFDAFPRAARDLARQCDKEVEVTITGRETELDKKIIEQISDPLIHLVRNAIDHGIERPAERLRKVKPAAGQLLISAEQQGNRILISVRDDGRGIDPEELRAAAIRRALAPAADLERWSVPELLELVFQPGFSTRASTTDVSGRGVGMDVVKNVVVRLGGAVRIQSEPDRGTTVILDLPLSLALLRVVLVETGDELFALPTASVRRLLHVRPDDITALQGGHVIDLAGETIPLTSLGVLLNGSASAVAPRQPVLVARAGEASFGLLVDAVHEEQELVFEELRHPLREHRTFAGAAILGNGDIVPILDVHALFELASRQPSIQAGPPAERHAAARVGRVLVVEDSLVAGELQKSILVAAGYEVEIAHDGAEGYEMILQKPWDLVVADVDMPRMDGLQLTARLRADERFHNLPVVIVTARDSIEDRRRGFDVGADAYVLKREFDQSHLLDTVKRLIGRAQPDLPVPFPGLPDA
jgi:two-component system, chemotaxis family, sensor kinase CheA